MRDQVRRCRCGAWRCVLIGTLMLAVWGLRPGRSFSAPAGTAPEGQSSSPFVSVKGDQTENRQAAEKKLASVGYREVLNTFNVFVAPSSCHGWGVFAAKDFVENELIHESPGRIVRGTAMEVRDDIFEIGWEDEEQDELSILGLGFASLHNHDDKPNAAALWEKSERFGGDIVGTFYALRNINRGEELFISYGDEWWSTRAVNKTTVNQAA